MWISPTGTSGGGGGGGGGFVAADLVALPQATNAQLGDASLAYVVTDPSGTPTSGKSTLSRIGTLPDSYLDLITDIFSPSTAVIGGNYTVGIAFAPLRAGQSCTGVRFLWNEASARTIKATLFDRNGSALKTATVTTSGTPGVFTATFSSAQSLSRSAGGYVIAVYETTGAHYQPGENPLTLYGVNMYGLLGNVSFRDYTVTGPSAYAGGDAFPTTTFNTCYLLEPVISG
jgi:hypothetical protein